MIKTTKKKLLKILEIDFVKFCIVGGTGFVINLVILIGLTKFLNISVFWGQLIGAETALFSNFLLHQNWTYSARKQRPRIPIMILQFHATSWPAIIGSTMMVTILVRVEHLGKLLALTISSFIALAWNYFWSKYVIWSDREKIIKERLEVS